MLKRSAHPTAVTHNVKVGLAQGKPFKAALDQAKKVQREAKKAAAKKKAK
jgi:hypothetical protein